MTNKARITAICKGYSEWSTDENGATIHLENDFDQVEVESYTVFNSDGRIVDSEIEAYEQALEKLHEVVADEITEQLKYSAKEEDKTPAEYVEELDSSMSWQTAELGNSIEPLANELIIDSEKVWELIKSNVKEN